MNYFVVQILITSMNYPKLPKKDISSNTKLNCHPHLAASGDFHLRHLSSVLNPYVFRRKKLDAAVGVGEEKKYEIPSPQKSHKKGTKRSVFVFWFIPTDHVFSHK